MIHVCVDIITFNVKLTHVDAHHLASDLTVVSGSSRQFYPWWEMGLIVSRHHDDDELSILLYGQR